MPTEPLEPDPRPKKRVRKQNEPNANSIQHGGNHYKKMRIEHWDYVVANDIPYLEAVAIKYLSRWRDKGGIEDLKKAAHYVQKLIEVEEAKLTEDKSKPFQPCLPRYGSCKRPKGHKGQHSQNPEDGM